MSDHDLLMRHDATLFAPATGLANVVLKNTVTLYGDGSKEHPGIVHVIWEHIRNQEETDKKRYRNLQLFMSAGYISIVLLEIILAVVHK